MMMFVNFAFNVIIMETYIGSYNYDVDEFPSVK